MSEDDRASIHLERSLHDFPRIHRSLRERATEEFFRVDESVLRIEEDHDERLVRLSREVEREEVTHFGWTLLHEHFTQSMDEAEGLGKKQRQAEKRSVEKALRDTEAWLTNLRRLHVRGRFSQEEFEREEREIRQEQFRLQESLSQIEVATARFEFEGMLDSFSKQAVFRFETGDSRQKRLIVRAVSSNTVLKDKVLRIEARKPFVEVDENRPCSNKLGLWDDVGTYLAQIEVKS